MQLWCWIPTYSHIHNRCYWYLYIWTIAVNELVSTTQCQDSPYCKHSLLYEDQFQKFENFLINVLSRLSLLNPITWLTLCSFWHCPHSQVFDSSQCRFFHSHQMRNCTQGFPMTWHDLYTETGNQWRSPKPNSFHHAWYVLSHCRPLDSGGLKG